MNETIKIGSSMIDKSTGMRVVVDSLPRELNGATIVNVHTVRTPEMHSIGYAALVTNLRHCVCPACCKRPAGPAGVCGECEDRDFVDA